MPTKRGTMTPQERRFISAYVDSADAQYAGEKAGYARPEANSYKNLAKPAIQAEIIKVQQDRITRELLPLAVNAIHRLLTDARTPAGAVVQAAKLVMDRTLGATDADKGKEPHELTGQELARQLDHLREEATRRGQLIDITPQPAKEPESGVFA